jgi:hypothetical protein
MVNIADVTTLINLLLTGQNDINIYPQADVDGDGMVNISDVTALISILLNA